MFALVILTTQRTAALSPREGLDWVGMAIKFIFSWIVLMPIAVIIAGKFLSQIIKLEARSKQLFKIQIKSMLLVQATDDEVIFGFTGFFITLLPIGILTGPTAYNFFRIQFGVDPGQFNSLCILSAFTTIVWSFFIFLFNKILRPPKDAVFKERDKLIEDLSRRTQR